MNDYSENVDAGNPYRERLYASVLQCIQAKKSNAQGQRDSYFCPRVDSIENYLDDIDAYRNDLYEMLGWPLKSINNETAVGGELIHLGQDEHMDRYRVWIECDHGLGAYGLYFQPRTGGPFPFVVLQHGAGGIAETPAQLNEYNDNSNAMVQQLSERGVAVYCNQTLNWKPEHGPELSLGELDKQLRYVGGSLAALDIYRVRSAIDFFSCQDNIDSDRIGMAGVSAGGFLTLFTAACDTRIRSSLSSCFFNNRLHYDWPIWTWKNSANLMLDSEIASLICPRALCIEVGRNDSMFKYETLPMSDIQQVEDRYAQLGLEDNILFNPHTEGHEIDPQHKGTNFFLTHLLA